MSFFDGTDWRNRIGKGKKRLPAVHHSGIAVHPDSGDRLFVATDIGVWTSEEGGAGRWEAFAGSLGMTTGSGIPVRQWLDLATAK